jgi:hypothetical protein
MRPFHLTLSLVLLPAICLRAQKAALYDSLLFSTPPFGLAKVESSIQQLGKFKYGAATALSQSQYDALTIMEKFTYNMIHEESFSQMCSMLPRQDSGAARIYGHLPRLTGEYSWSARQFDFFKKNRDTVARLIKEVIDKDGGAGLNLLDVIVLINAKELIPVLIDKERRHPYNHYILTTLMLLLTTNLDSDFLASAQYARLYGTGQAGESAYTAFLPYTKANEELILRQAAKFYHDTVRR